jgi:hypothetical protein
MRGGEVGFRSRCEGWRACTREHACVSVTGSSRRWRSSGEVCQCKTRVRPCVVEVPRWEASAEGGTCGGVASITRRGRTVKRITGAREARARNPRDEPAENERGVRVDDAPSRRAIRLSPARQAALYVEFDSCQPEYAELWTARSIRHAGRHQRTRESGLRGRVDQAPWPERSAAARCPRTTPDRPPRQTPRRRPDREVGEGEMAMTRTAWEHTFVFKGSRAEVTKLAHLPQCFRGKPQKTWREIALGSQPEDRRTVSAITESWAHRALSGRVRRWPPVCLVRSMKTTVPSNNDETLDRTRKTASSPGVL